MLQNGNYMINDMVNEQSLYIDAQGRQSPCCWLGSRQIDFVSDINDVMQTWHSDQPHPVCVSTCGTDSKQSNFSAQWHTSVKKEVKFDHEA